LETFKAVALKEHWRYRMPEKKIVGKREIISILDLELFDLDAKVDTGADSNALHCDDL